jgi:tRNA pseudouridine38-40 synthase
MPNYRIKIQYDGTNYSGWQSQPSRSTIQDEIIKAISIITKEDVNIVGSGRTDAGVHSLGQVANFRTENKYDIIKIKHSLNSILPRDISIDDMAEVDENFHSRFDAKIRSYIYLISRKKSPFWGNYSYLYPYVNSIDLNRLRNISSVLIGKHDFTSFCKAKTNTENKVCNVNSIYWKDTKGLIIFMIEADRFLHGMVRTIVGTLLKLASENKDKVILHEILDLQNREAAGESLPAKGLFLYKVKY